MKVIKGKCHVVVKNKQGEIVREYDQESEQKINEPERNVQTLRRWCNGGYRKRKIIYDRYDEWWTSVG